MAAGWATPAAAQLGGNPPRSDPLPPRVSTPRLDDDPKPIERPRPRYRNPGPRFYYERGYYDDENSLRARLPRREAVRTPPEEPAPEPEPDRGPPDPGSPRTVIVPRGADAPPEPQVEIGAPLPEGRPLVTLDWRVYELPEPGPGEIYVRLGRDVLLINATSREVVRLVDPETERAADKG